MVIEDAPAWQTSDGIALTGGHHSVSARAPGEALRGYTLRVASPSPAVASMAQADLGDVVLDESGPGGWPDGWTVTSMSCAAPATHERDVAIAQTKRPARSASR